jgi:hypothetical protein
MSTSAFTALLVLFAVFASVRGFAMLRRIRVDPPGNYTRPVLAIAVLYLAIATAAIIAAVLHSAIAFWFVAGLSLLVPMVRVAAGRRTGP